MNSCLLIEELYDYILDAGPNLQEQTHKYHNERRQNVFEIL